MRHLVSTTLVNYNAYNFLDLYYIILCFEEAMSSASICLLEARQEGFAELLCTHIVGSFVSLDVKLHRKTAVYSQWPDDRGIYNTQRRSNLRREDNFFPLSPEQHFGSTFNYRLENKICKSFTLDSARFLRTAS